MLNWFSLPTFTSGEVTSTGVVSTIVGCAFFFRFPMTSHLDFNLEEFGLPFRLTTLGLRTEVGTPTMLGRVSWGLGPLEV